MIKDVSTNINVSGIVSVLSSHNTPIRDTEDDDAKDDEPNGLDASKIFIMKHSDMRQILVSSGYRRG